MPTHNVPHMAPQGIYLQSDQGVALNETGSRMSFPLRDSIIIPGNVDGFVQLSSFRYSNVFYNINTHKNVFSYALSSDISKRLSVTVQPGNYNITSLLIYLNEALSDGFLVLTYDPVTFKITAENNTWGFILYGDSMLPYLGFPATTAQDVTVTGLHAINLGGVSVVNIGLPSLHIASNGTRGYSVSILDQILNDVLVGSTNSINNYSSTKYRISQSIITAIEVELTGDNGLELDFLGTPWFLALQMSFIYNFEYKAPPPSLTEHIQASTITAKVKPKETESS